VKKLETGAFDDDARAADLLQEYEAVTSFTAAAPAKLLGISRAVNGLTSADFALMARVGSHMIACKKRAEECRRLAKLRAGSDHWVAFLEMAETWEKLADLHELGRRLRSSGVLLEPPAYAHQKH
jgi:hypothetical protein